MNVGDLYVRLRAEGVGDVIAQMRQASNAFDELASLAGGTVAAVEEMGRAMRSAAAEVGAMGLSMIWAARTAAGMAAEEELALLRWQAILGERAQDFFAAVREEAQRTGYFMGNFSEMLEALIPASQLVREDMETFLAVMRAVNEVLVASGVSAERYRYVWYLLAKAAVEGSAEFLAEGSRWLQAQVVQGDKALAILREMNKELGVTQNLRIILRAILASERPAWEATQQVIESNAGRLRTLSGVFRETVESIGRGALEIEASLAGVATRLLRWFEGLQVAPGVGRWLTFTGLAAALAGLPAVLERIGGLLGRLLGLGTVTRGAFLRLAAALAAVGLVMEDVWLSLQGKESLFRLVWRWFGVEEAVTRLPEEAKLAITGAIGYLTWKLASYFATHPGVLVKLGGAALMTFSIILALEPLWRLLPGVGLDEAISRIPWTLRTALMAAGFALIGWTFGGPAGLAIGITLGVGLSLLWGLIANDAELRALLERIPPVVSGAMIMAGFAALGALAGLALGGPVSAAFGLTLGVVLSLVWGLATDNAGLMAIVERIPREIFGAMTMAGFTFLGAAGGAYFAGPVGAAVGAVFGFTIGVVLNVIFGARFHRDQSVAEVRELAQQEIQEIQEAIVGPAAAIPPVTGADYSQLLGAVQERIATFANAMRAQYGEAAAAYAGLGAALRALAGVEDEAVRARLAEDLLAAFAWPEDARRILETARHSLAEAERLYAEVAGPVPLVRAPAAEPVGTLAVPAVPAPEAPRTEVHVTIAPGAVHVEGTLSESVKEEIVHEALRAVEEGLRTALDEEVR